MDDELDGQEDDPRWVARGERLLPAGDAPWLYDMYNKERARRYGGADRGEEYREAQRDNWADKKDIYNERRRERR